MNLLQEKELIWTSVVANSMMNRERNLTGINSYEKDLYFDILAFIKYTLNTGHHFHWIDLCCGKGKALLQAFDIFSKTDFADKIFLEGIDLVDMFENDLRENQPIKLYVKSLLDWIPTQKYDLITCVHGLHYVGDKLSVLEKVGKALKDNGKFIGNIDFESVQNTHHQSLKKEILSYLDTQELVYNTRRKILICEGYTALDFPYQYLGANAEAGKNYTGQEAVDSIYTNE